MRINNYLIWCVFEGVLKIRSEINILYYPCNFSSRLVTSRTAYVVMNPSHFCEIGTWNACIYNDGFQVWLNECYIYHTMKIPAHSLNSKRYYQITTTCIYFTDNYEMGLVIHALILVDLSNKRGTRHMVVIFMFLFAKAFMVAHIVGVNAASVDWRLPIDQSIKTNRNEKNTKTFTLPQRQTLRRLLSLTFGVFM